MLSSPKHEPEQKQASVTSSMSLTEEGEVVGGGSVAPPLPVVTSNTGPVDPFLSSLGNEEIRAAFVNFMSAMQVRDSGFNQRV